MLGGGGFEGLEGAGEGGEGVFDAHAFEAAGADEADGVGVVGPETDVGSSSSPFGGSRWLATSQTPTCALDSAPSHNSTAVDGCVPDGAYDDAWTYLVAG